MGGFAWVTLKIGWSGLRGDKGQFKGVGKRGKGVGNQINQKGERKRQFKYITLELDWVG